MNKKEVRWITVSKILECSQLLYFATHVKQVKTKRSKWESRMGGDGEAREARQTRNGATVYIIRKKVTLLGSFRFVEIRSIRFGS